MKRVVFLLLLMCTASGVYSQKVDLKTKVNKLEGQVELLKEDKKTLEEQVKALEKQLALKDEDRNGKLSLKDQELAKREKLIEKIRKEKDSIAGVLKGVRDENRKYKDTDKKLKNTESKRDYYKDSLGRLETRFKDLEKKYKKYNVETLSHQIDSLKGVIASLNSTLEDKKEHVKKFDAFIGGFARQQLKEREPYLELLYSEMVLDTLKSVSAQMEPYVANGEIASLKERFDKAIDYKEALSAGIGLLEKQYNRDEVDASNIGLANIGSSEMTGKQYKEFELCMEVLFSYSEKVQALSAFVEKINSNSDINDYRESKDDLYIESFAETCETIRKECGVSADYFKNIPFLAGTFKKYMELLKDDPFRVKRDGEYKELESVINDMNKQATAEVY